MFVTVMEATLLRHLSLHFFRGEARAVNTDSSLHLVTGLLTITISTRVNFHSALNDPVDKSFASSPTTSLKSTSEHKSGREPESILSGRRESVYSVMHLCVNI
jgi:hypothetical protein